MDLFSILDVEENDNIQTLLNKVCTTCTDCHLSILHPNNKGLIWRGSIDAKIAVLGEAPGSEEMENNKPLIGKSGKLFEQWAKKMRIDTVNNCFITNIVSCQPEKVKDKEGILKQRAPTGKEILRCFPNKVLPILKSLPNLEVVIILGHVAASALLEESVNIQSHENKWFECDLLPGIPCFILPHPASLLYDAGMDKSARLEFGLKLFLNQYVKTKRILEIIKNPLRINLSNFKE